MNKTLALYFDDQCIIGAVEPFDGKFTRIEKGGRDRFYLCFYIHEGKVDYGQAYQADVEKSDHRAVGNIYQKISTGGAYHFFGYDREYVNLLDPVMDDIREAYIRILSTMSDSSEVLRVSDPVPVALGFSPNISRDVCATIKSYLEQKNFTYDPGIPQTSFSRLIIQHKLSQRALETPGIYAVVEGLNADLNVTLIEIHSNLDIQQITHASYPGFGTDPRVGVIARFVVDKADESIHLLHSQEDKENEYKLKFRMAREWNDQLLRSRRPFIHVRVALSPAPHSELTVSVIRKEIDGLTMVRSQQVARYAEHTITPHLPMADLTAIIIFGDSLKNSQVLDGFYRFGKEKLIVHGDDQIFDVLKGLLAREETPPVSTSSVTDFPKTPQNTRLQSIRSIDLKSGDRLEFTWEPNRLVVAESQGNGGFRIIRHENSSIITGDTFMADSIHVGQRAYLKNVVRPSSGQVLGNYQSGIIKSLRVITE